MSTFDLVLALIFFQSLILCDSIASLHDFDGLNQFNSLDSGRNYATDNNQLVRQLFESSCFATELSIIHLLHPKGKIYFYLLFNAIRSNYFASLTRQKKLLVFKEFGVTYLKARTALDFSTLNYQVAKDLTLYSIKSNNLPIFKELFVAHFFDLNAEYSEDGYEGNAVVLLKNRDKHLAFAIRSGLDLTRSVKDANGYTMGIKEFVLSNGSHKSFLIVSRAIKTISTSFSSKRSVSSSEVSKF